MLANVTYLYDGSYNNHNISNYESNEKRNVDDNDNSGDDNEKYVFVDDKKQCKNRTVSLWMYKKQHYSAVHHSLGPPWQQWGIHTM